MNQPRVITIFGWPGPCSPSYEAVYAADHEKLDEVGNDYSSTKSKDK